MPETSDEFTAPRTGVRIPVIGPAWRAVTQWFGNVPIADPVDRRNAPVLQLIALLLAVLPSLAWWYRAYAPNETQLAQLEAQARAEQRGLWADLEPVPPWQWRKARAAR